jgi:hypothetical protein
MTINIFIFRQHWAKLGNFPELGRIICSFALFQEKEKLHSTAKTNFSIKV